ncbi:MAG: hypothetical protein RL385_295 [Pseudomonadota bacterium]|jgi:hypothetical protein
MPTLVPAAQPDFELGLRALLVSFGASEVGLDARIRVSVEASLAALAHSAEDGRSLHPHEVLRIRTGKFAAAQLPAEVYRDRARLSALRAGIGQLIEAWLGPPKGSLLGV